MGKRTQIINGLLYINIASYSKRKQLLLFCCLCFLFLILNIGSLFLPYRESLTYDEWYYYQSGVDILSGKPSETKLPVPNVMPALALNPLFSKVIRAGIPDQLISVSTKNLGKIYAGKLATIFVSLILASYVFLWSRELYGVNAGFLALSLYILDPNIIAHSRIVHQDLFGACAVFIATYYFWRFLKFGGAKNAVLSMVTFGIAQITRYTAIYLIPIYLVLSLGFYRATLLNLLKNRNYKIIGLGLKKITAYSLLLVFTSIIIINIGFSGERTFTKWGDYKFTSKTFTDLQSKPGLAFLRELPVPVPYAYLRGLDVGKAKQDTGIGSGSPYLMGRLGIENGKLKGFNEYYIIAFIYKVPIATQLLLFLAIISLIRYRKYINFWQNEAFLSLPALFFFIAFSLTTAQLGIRYILMIFPFFYVLSSRVVLSWTTLKKKYCIFITSLITYLLISNLSYFPHYLSYFNELLVDRKLAYTILADSNLDWGQNKNYLIDYLKNKPDVMYTSQIKKSIKEINKVELPNRIFDPEIPNSGTVVISANELVGIVAKAKRYQWIRENLRPVDHIAYSYLVFKIQPQDLPSKKL